MTPEEEARWPLHAKLKRADAPQIAQLTRFITWLEEKRGLFLGKYEFEGKRGDLIPVYENDMELALDFVCHEMCIDRAKLIEEGDDMYTYLKNHPYFNQ